MIGIYKIINPKGKIYIGQSVNIKRRRKEYEKIKCISQPKLYNSFKKHGVENHKFEIIEECSLDQLNEKEIYWKQYYINLVGWEKVLFCQLIDGEGGYKNKETKNKMSLYAKNRPQEHNQKISNKMTGYKQTQQHKLNRSKAIKGKKFRSKIVLQYDLKDNFIKEWPTAKSACLFYNSKDLNGVSACCLGKQKTAFGYKWKYKNN